MPLSRETVEKLIRHGYESIIPILESKIQAWEGALVDRQQCELRALRHDITGLREEVLQKLDMLGDKLTKVCQKSDHIAMECVSGRLEGTNVAEKLGSAGLHDSRMPDLEPGSPLNRLYAPKSDVLGPLRENFQYHIALKDSLSLFGYTRVRSVMEMQRESPVIVSLVEDNERGPRRFIKIFPLSDGNAREIVSMISACGLDEAIYYIEVSLVWVMVPPLSRFT